MDVKDFAAAYQRDLVKAIDQIDLDRVATVVDWMREIRRKGNQIFICGNGGSASTASHFACDILKGASYNRPERFRILALTDACPTISAYSNDVGYEVVFVEQLKNLARPGDLVIGLSGSGNSANVIRAIEYANSLGCKTVAMTGYRGGRLGSVAQLHINTPANHMGRIEDAHMITCHMIGYYFMDTEG